MTAPHAAYKPERMSFQFIPFALCYYSFTRIQKIADYRVPLPTEPAQFLNLTAKTKADTEKYHKTLFIYEHIFCDKKIVQEYFAFLLHVLYILSI